MSELVIVGVSSVIAAALTLMICKLIVSYIDKKSKKTKYHNEQYKKVEMGKAYNWFLQHMTHYISIDYDNISHTIITYPEKMWNDFKKAMEE